MVMDGSKKIQCDSPVPFSAPQYLGERCFEVCKVYPLVMMKSRM